MKIQSEILVVLFILSLSILFRSYNLELRLPFSWDQDRDAQVIWQIVNEGKLTLIGPRVISDSAFFLGPLWYYLLTPFYMLFGMDPIAVGFFAVFVGALTTLTFYLATKKIFGKTVGIFASLIWASISNVVTWNPMLIPIFTLIFIFCLMKILEGNRKYIVFGFLLIGLSLQLHFQTLFLFFPFTLANYYYFQKNRQLPYRYLMTGFLLFVLTFLPLIIFDLRHDFLNWNGLIRLFSGSGVSNEYQFSYFHYLNVTFFKFINSLNFYVPKVAFLPDWVEVVLGILTLAFSLLGIWISKISINKKLILYSFILPALVLIPLYKGNISEYYFMFTHVVIIFGLAVISKYLFQKNIVTKILICIIFMTIFLTRTKEVLTEIDYGGLYFKRQAVQYLVNQQVDPIFNVSYSAPANGDAGFDILFKVYGREPQNGHLWTIVIPSTAENIPPIATFGEIGIIRR